ncbi:MAG: NirD/YgiW/YdeI family stress tolerance protein [Campylobacter sp.]|nr:NirD/YgiW/YdeI family stress tolerance protein [Campylobacter sp.]
MIKKFMISATLAGVVFAQGGFVEDADKMAAANSRYKAASISEVKICADDTKVMIEGKIVKKLGGDKYEFVDDKGDKITVEINEEDFRGQRIAKNTNIRIKGEVDKDANGVEIDTDWLEIAIVEW